MTDQTTKRLYRTGYVLILLCTLLPLTGEVLLRSDALYQWTLKVNELAGQLSHGHLPLFVSPDIFRGSEDSLSAVSFFHSNIFILPAAILYGLTKNLVIAYQGTLLLLQLGTLLSSFLFFRSIFSNKNAIFFGVLLYMTCPYRLNLCYEQGDFAGAAFFLLVPLVFWSLTGIKKTLPFKENVLRILLSSALFALCGYANALYLPILFCLVFVIGILYRNLLFWISSLLGMLLCLPGMLPLLRYLLTGNDRGLFLPLSGIMQNGYQTGELFTAFAYRPSHPGLGLGLLLAAALFFYLRFVTKKQTPERICMHALYGSILFMIFSLARFPWDIFQRLNGVFLRYFALLESPVLFFGFACFFLSIPAADALGELDEDPDRLVSLCGKLIILFAAVGNCIYLCNTFLYQIEAL